VHSLLHHPNAYTAFWHFPQQRHHHGLQAQQHSHSLAKVIPTWAYTCCLCSCALYVAAVLRVGAGGKERADSNDMITAGQCSGRLPNLRDPSKAIIVWHAATVQSTVIQFVRRTCM
jgi:hypothetical protein